MDICDLLHLLCFALAAVAALLLAGFAERRIEVREDEPKGKVT